MFPLIFNADSTRISAVSFGPQSLNSRGNKLDTLTDRTAAWVSPGSSLNVWKTLIILPLPGAESQMSNR